MKCNLFSKIESICSLFFSDSLIIHLKVILSKIFHIGNFVLIKQISNVLLKLLIDLINTFFFCLRSYVTLIVSQLLSPYSIHYF